MAHKTWYEQYWNILGVAGLGFAVRHAIQQEGGGVVVVGFEEADQVPKELDD